MARAFVQISENGPRCQKVWPPLLWRNSLQLSFTRTNDKSTESFRADETAVFFAEIGTPREEKEKQTRLVAVIRFLFFFFVCATRTKEKTNQQKRTREIHDTRGARKVVEDMTGRHFQLIESARRSKAKKGKRNDNKEKAKCRKTNTKTSQKKKERRSVVGSSTSVW